MNDQRKETCTYITSDFNVHTVGQSIFYIRAELLLAMPHHLEHCKQERIILLLYKNRMRYLVCTCGVIG